MATNIFTQELTDGDFRRLCQAVYRHCGIHLTEAKRALVRTRLVKRLKATGRTDFHEYIEFVLSRNPEARREFGAMVDALSTNFTSFFREIAHFDYLRQSYLPQLMTQQPRGRRLRAWSAACSSGEEPYSLAITLLEESQGHGSWDIKILATDVSHRMLEIAQMCTYDAQRVAPLSTRQKQKFLVPNVIDGQKVYQVAPALRQMVTFRYLNLMESWPFQGPFDFVFCRNVMIYFDKPTQERLVNRIYDVLAPGGILCIGHSESLTGIRHRYRYLQPATYARPE